MWIYGDYVVVMVKKKKKEMWGESYPKQLPNGFENIGAMNINNTLPNPNAIENKIQELNKIGENE